MIVAYGDTTADAPNGMGMEDNVNQRYNPCFECRLRHDRQYSSDCENNCEYAYAIKLRDSNIEDLNTIIKNLEDQIAEEKARVAKLITRNALLNYDLGRAYQIIGEVVEQ